MSEHPLVTVPNPVLSRPASPCGEPDPDLAAELVDALRVAPGCVGLTAPQIGVSVRALCVDVSTSPVVRERDWPHHGLVVLFDPELVHAEGADVRREGCVSVPHFTADVRRATRVTVRGASPEGEVQTVDAHGFEARALHHQLDHLDGRLILDRSVRAPTAALRELAGPRTG